MKWKLTPAEPTPEEIMVEGMYRAVGGKRVTKVKAVSGAMTALSAAGYVIVKVDDALVERVARGICEGATDAKWANENDDAKEGWRIEARVAIAAIKGEG